MYFISRMYQTIKGLIAMTGVTGSVLAIVYGSMASGGTVFVVGGVLCMANSLFNIIEIGKVTVDIRKQIHTLETTIDGFLRDGKANNEAHAKENRKLRELLDKSEIGGFEISCG